MKAKAKKILIVDDEIETCKMIRRFLSRRGFKVEEAHDGLEGLKYIRDLKPDLIILDVKMPKMDGFESLRQIKSDPECLKIPVIMLTMKNEPPNLDKGINLGAEFYLPKPFRLENLMEFIKLIF